MSRNGDDPTDKGDRNFVGWILGVNATLLVLGVGVIGSVLWSMNSSVVALRTSVDGFQARFSSVEASIVTVSQSRYSGADAAKDRESIMALIQQVLERNRTQDFDINRLLEFKAKAEERLSLKGPMQP